MGKVNGKMLLAFGFTILVGLSASFILSIADAAHYGLIISFTVLTLLLIWQVLGAKDVFNPVSSFVLGAFLLYGLVGLLFFFDPQALTSYGFKDYIPSSMLIIALAILGLVLGYKSQFHKVVSQRLIRIKSLRWGWNHQKVVGFFLLYYSLIWFYRIIVIYGGSYFSIMDINNIPKTNIFLNAMGFFFSDKTTGNIIFIFAMLYISILITKKERGSFPKKSLLMLMVFSIIELAMNFIGGSRAFLLNIFLMFMFVNNYIKKPLKLFRIVSFSIPIVLVVFLIYTYGTFYRSTTSAYLHMPSVYTNLKDSYDLFNSNLFEGSDNSIQYLQKSFLARMDAINSLTAAISYIENTGEYWFGKSFILPFQALIPRAMWKSKGIFADYVVDNVFGRKVGILMPYQYNVWITVALPTEFYMNIGIIGVIVFMFFTGIIYRISYELIKTEQSAPGNIMFYFIFWYFTVYLGFYYATSIIIIQLIAKMLFLYIALKIVSTRKISWNVKSNSRSVGGSYILL